MKNNNNNNDINLFARKGKKLKTRIVTNWIYSQNIGMEFSIEKHAQIIMRSEKEK